MAAFDNLGFETAGASAGLAQSWTQAQTSTAIEIADFVGLAAEGFESGWGADPYIEEFDLGVDVAAAPFDSAATVQAFEDFENLWTETVNLA